MSEAGNSKPEQSKKQNAKIEKLKARLPRGLGDRSAGDLVATHHMLEAIRSVYDLYGFEALETPFIEYTDALGKFLPDLDRPNEGVFSFQDDDEQWLSLRYDLTAPLARHVAENFDALAKPYRSYRAGWVFRNEKPGPGRFRQFMQFDADTVGSAAPAADAEMCMMMADVLEKVGIRRGDYVIRVNNRKVLDGILEVVGLGGEDKAGQRLTVLRAFDKLDKFSWEEVAKLLGPGRRDESGDFTKGANLEPRQIEDLKRFRDFAAEIADTHFPEAARMLAAAPEAAETRYETVRQELSSFGESERLRDGVEELIAIHKLCAASGYARLAGEDAPERVRIDPSVVRGLEYYTGPVYEAELTFQVTGDDGQPVRFGSVGGGGRYDGLVGRFRAEPVPATGFSIGVSRLLAALKAVQSPLVVGAEPVGPVVVLVMDRDRIADYQRMVATLREAGIRAELYLGSSGMKAQMKYADRRKSPCVVIQGSDERERGEVQIKDLVAGAKAADAIATNAEWKSARPAQISVSTDKLVQTIREILSSQAD